MPSENGWEPAQASSDQCEWITVPGTNVRLQLLKGQPVAILRAFAADFNAFIEPLRDADSAGWTPTNAVPTSNHLNGTAMDLDWDSHPFRVLNAGFDDAQIATIRDMLDFYENTVWWGNDWDVPKDSMHWNMGYNTYNNPHTQDFINRKIRADGYSTYRRGNAPVLSQADLYALAVIREGQRLNFSRKGICIALSVPFVESGWKMYANANIPESLALPHDAVGSDHDSVGLFQQRQAWGPLSETMDPTGSARLFYLGGHNGQRGLSDFPYDTDERTPGGWAQAVQVSAFPDRYDEHWDAANTLYDRLSSAAPTTVPPLPPTTPPQGEDELSAEAERLIQEIHREVTQKLTSRSPLRHLGEGPLDTVAGFILNADGSEHVEIVRLLASYGHPPTLALLEEVANADPIAYPDRQGDRLIAQAILADVTSHPSAAPAPVVVPVVPQPAPVVYAPAPVAPAAPSTKGQVLGVAYDALSALLAADVFAGPEKEPLTALIAALQSKIA